MKRWRALLSLVLVVWVLFSGFTFIELGHKYIGNDYFESEELGSSIDYFLQELGPTVLNPIDAEEMKKRLTVSQEEIEDHRNRFGSLTEQVDSIRQQYIDPIQEAVDLKATDLEKKLEEERDAKIADITQNFASDEHVKAKVLAEKQQLVDRYVNELHQKQKSLFQSFPFIAYELTNIETGETFKRGNVNGANVYKKAFIFQEPLITQSLSEEAMNTWYELERSVSISLMEDYELREAFNKEHRYTGTVSISKAAFNKSNYSANYVAFNRNQMIFSSIWISGIIFIIVLLFTRLKPRLENYLHPIKMKQLLQRLSIDIQFVLFVVNLVLFTPLLIMAYEPIEYSQGPVLLDMIFSFGLLFVLGVAMLLQGIWLYDRIKTWDQLIVALRGSHTWRLGDSLRDLFITGSIGWQSFTLIIATFFGGVGVMGIAMGMGDPTILIPLFVGILIGIPSMLLFLSRIGYLNRIMKDTEAMAEGRLVGDIQVLGKSPFAKHAEHLNKLRAGVAHSINEQAKSERLKAELITNVSHDLRTPLTSIITYTDLLKNPDITEEERKQYIDVLDKKSARLKTLIEDLFEVSKMASGNVELNKERVDLSQLVKQAVGEHEEELRNANLDLRMTLPDAPMTVYVDGQKWWRVVDNLIVNVLKYALAGTRVYVTLKNTVAGEAELVVKNVAKYELNENAEELTERFKRADTSRNTEGSGLGLAIAQSIVDLHSGRMTIEIDGDLFKVTVTLPVV